MIEWLTMVMKCLACFFVGYDPCTCYHVLRSFLSIFSVTRSSTRCLLLFALALGTKVAIKHRASARRCNCAVPGRVPIAVRLGKSRITCLSAFASVKPSAI